MNCPECGKDNWLATSNGCMCKECGFVVGKTPVLGESE